MEIWEPKPPGTLWATPGLLRDSSFRYGEMSPSYRGGCEAYDLLGCDAVWFSRYVPTLLGNLLPKP